MIHTRHLLALVAICTAAACKKDQPAADYQTPGAPASPMPVKFSLADFQHLRYLEGAWRGTMPDGKFFYESYRFLNDSTILQGGHPDSTFAMKTDSSMYEFRGGEIVHGTSTKYHAAALDSTTVDFRADADPKTHFVWTREGPDAWTARLFRAGPDGAEQVTVYPIKRVKR